MSHRRHNYHHHPSSTSSSASSESSNRVLLVLIACASVGYLLYQHVFKPLWQAHLDRMARKTGADLLKNSSADPKQAQTSQQQQQQQQQPQQHPQSQANGHDANQASKDAAAPLHRPPKSSNKSKKSRSASSKDNKDPQPAASGPDGPDAAAPAAKENVAPAPPKKRNWSMPKAHKSAKGKATSKSNQNQGDAPPSELPTTSVGVQAVPEASHSAMQAHARSRSSSIAQHQQLQQIESLSRDAAQGLARLNMSTQHSLAGPSNATSPFPVAPQQQQDHMLDYAPAAAPKGHRHQTSTASSYNGPPTAKILPQTLLSKQQNGDHKDVASPTNSVLSQPDSNLFSPQSTSTNLSSTATAPSLHLSSSQEVPPEPVASTSTDEVRQPLSNSSTIRKGKSPHARRRHQPQPQQQQQQPTSWVPGLPKSGSTASSSSSSDQGQGGDPTPQQSSSSASQREEDDGGYWRQKPRDDAVDFAHDRTLRGRDFEAASSSIRPARSSSSSVVSVEDSEPSASRPRSGIYSSSSDVQLPHRSPSPTTLLPGARMQKTAFAVHHEAAQAAAQESAIDSPALSPAADLSRPRRASYQFPGSNQHHQQQGRASRSARNSFSHNNGANQSNVFGSSTRSSSNGYQPHQHQQPPQSASMTYQNWLQQQMQFQQQQHMFATQQQQHPAYQLLQAQITQQVKNLQAQCQANIMSQAQALAASTSGATPDPASVPAISQAPQMSQSVSYGGSPAHTQFNRKAPPPALLLPNSTSQQPMPNGLTSSQSLSNPELASSIGSHQGVSPLAQSTTYLRSMAQQQQALRTSQSQFLSEPSPLPSRPASRAHSISSATSSHHPGGHASTIDVSQQPALSNPTLGLSTSSSNLQQSQHPQQPQQQQNDPDKYALLERLSALEDKVLAAQVENERKNKELEIASWRLHCAEAERAADDRHKLDTIRKLEDRLRASEQSGLASSADEEAKTGAADSRHRSDSLSATSEASISGAHTGASPYHKPSALPPRLDMTNVPSNSASPFQYYSSPTSAQSVYPPDMLYQTGGMLPAPNFNGPYQRYRSNHNSQYRRKGKKNAANQTQRNGSNPSYSQASSPRIPPPRQASQSGDSAAGRTDDGESGDADEDDLVIMLRPDGSASKHILADQNLNAGLLGLGYDVESHYASAEDDDPTGPEPGEEWIGSIPSAYTKKPKEDASQDTTLTPNDKEPDNQREHAQPA